jgi:hypothetical protein
VTKLAVVLLALWTARAEADGTTVAGQGAAAGVVLTGGTALLMRTFFACGFKEGEPNSRWCLDGRAGIVVPVVTVAATIASVHLIGDARDGTGSWLGTTLGFAGGFVVGVGAAAIVQRLTKRDLAAAIALLGTTAVGTVVGYQLTSDNERALRVSVVSRSF